VKIYWLYYLWYLVPAVITVAVVSAYSALAGLVLAVTCIVIPTAVIAIWIPRFYNSISFKLEKDHAYARYGVWWVKEKRVPYNLVAEVRLRQGPVQRKLGLACVDLYTPATGTTRPELTFFQLDYSEAVSVAEEARRRVGILTSRERRIIEEEILSELRRIRSILEESLKKPREEGER